MSSSSSSSGKKEPKLSVRNQTCFKRSSFSSTKNTNLALREKTMLKKAYELSTLCDNDICIIHYDRNGQLVRTWPEDQSKVRDMAERFSRLRVKDKFKKNTNLSQCLNKRLFDDKKKSFENETKRTKYTEKILDFEGLLVNKLKIWKERVRVIHNFALSPGFFSKDLPSSSSLVEDPLMNGLQQQTGSFTNLLMTGGDVSTTHSMNQPRQNELSEQNGNYFPKDLPSSSSALIEAPLMNFCEYCGVPHHQQQTGSFTNLLMGGGDVSTTDSLNHPRHNRLPELQNRNYYPGFFPKDLPSSSSALIEAPWMNFCPYVPVPHHQQQTQPFTNLLMSGGDVSVTSTEQDLSLLVYNSTAATDSSNNLRQNKPTFTSQLPDSLSSSFDQTYNLKL